MERAGAAPDRDDASQLSGRSCARAAYRTTSVLILLPLTTARAAVARSPAARCRIAGSRSPLIFGVSCPTRAPSRRTSTTVRELRASCSVTSCRVAWTQHSPSGRSHGASVSRCFSSPVTWIAAPAGNSECGTPGGWLAGTSMRLGQIEPHRRGDVPAGTRRPEPRGDLRGPSPGQQRGQHGRVAGRLLTWQVAELPRTGPDADRVPVVLVRALRQQLHGGRHLGAARAQRRPEEGADRGDVMRFAGHVHAGPAPLAPEIERQRHGGQRTANM